MLSINTNLSSLIAQRSMQQSTSALNQAIERMTTGFKINHAKDNAANYSISTNLETKIGSYNVAADNVGMGMDLITTASDMISLMQDYGTRLQALSTQARNGTYGEQSIDAIKSEVNAIMKEIDRLSATAEYNGVSLFEGGSDGNGFITNPKTYSDAEVKAMTTMTQAIKEGTLTSGGTYSISSVAELQALAEYVNDGNDTTGMTFVLGANIDLSSVSNWTAIGGIVDTFKGTFDGNGHIIDFNNLSSFRGLFGNTNTDSIIKNVGVENCNVEGHDYVGGLAGRVYGDITNCYATGVVSGNNCVGMLVGDVLGDTTNCYAIGNVSGNKRVGGLTGKASGDITNSYAAGDVNGNERVGGLVGEANNVTNCYAAGNVSCTGNWVGGLAAQADGILNSYATGNVNGNNRVGGLVGEAGSVSNCYATGAVIGNERVGGLVGHSTSPISNSYATGVVTGIAGSYSYANSADWDGTKFTYNYETIGYSINLDGSRTGAFTLQVGINGDESCRLDLNTNCFYMLGAVKSDITSDRALDAITKFNSMLSEKSTQLGAVQNRLDSALDSIEVNIANLTSSLSTIRDADIAEVSSEYIRQQILQQASATLMATANQAPAIALQLI